MTRHAWKDTAMTLIDELRAWAAGDYGIEAAVDLLAAHHTWLTRPDFRDLCVISTADHLVENFHMPRAWLDFDKAGAIAGGGTLPASSSELQILAIAAGLADAPTSRPLGDLIRGLDTANLALVLDAIAHTGGWHEHRATPDGAVGYRHTVTGHVGRSGGGEA